jgi:hypothetical protein
VLPQIWWWASPRPGNTRKVSYQRQSFSAADSGCLSNYLFVVLAAPGRKHKRESTLAN